MSNSIKRPRPCIFCGERPGTTKEHFYPRWMVKAGLLKLGRANKYIEYGFEQSPAIGKQVRPVKSRPGDLSTKQFRVVCQKCNGGWMSGLEQKCRQSLEFLAAGKTIELNGLAQHDLARWIAMKVICLEHNRDRRFTTTPASDRRKLMDGEIPAYFNIYVGNHSLAQDTKIERETHTVAINSETPDPPLGDVKKNIAQVRVLLGRAFIVVHICRANNLNMVDYMSVSLKRNIFNRMRMFPQQQDVVIRPIEPVLDRADYAILEGSFAQMLKVLNPRWIPDFESDEIG